MRGRPLSPFGGTGLSSPDFSRLFRAFFLSVLGVWAAPWLAGSSNRFSAVQRSGFECGVRWQAPGVASGWWRRGTRDLAGVSEELAGQSQPNAAIPRSWSDGFAQSGSVRLHLVATAPLAFAYGWIWDHASLLR